MMAAADRPKRKAAMKSRIQFQVSGTCGMDHMRGCARKCAPGGV